MRIDTQHNSVDLRVETVLDVLHVAPDLLAYSLVRTAKVVRADACLPRIPASVADSCRQGFVDAAGARALRRGDPHADLPLVVATPEFLESMRTGGFPWLVEEGFGPLRALRETPPFDVLRADPAAADRIVRVDTDGHVLLDARGNPLPCAVRFDAASMPRLDDGRWDLDALADLLDARDDVIALDADGNVPDPVPASAREGIHAIPWEKGEKRAIAFLWRPAAAAYASAWEAAARIAGNRDPSLVATHLHRAVIREDLLGLAEARLDAAQPPRR